MENGKTCNRGFRKWELEPNDSNAPEKTLRPFRACMGRQKGWEIDTTKMIDQKYSAIRRFMTSGWLMAAVVLFLHSAVTAAPDDEEVVLGFSHPAVGQYYVNAVYSDNTVYLPVMELFNLLYVHYEKGGSGQSLQGTWLTPDNPWQINLNTLQAMLGKERYTLTVGDFRFGELDLYISPELF